MTSDLPRLSETHPTLWNKLGPPNYGFQENFSHLGTQRYVAKIIQSCTVDKAEHERLKQKEFLTLSELLLTKQEVERLKKELKDAYSGGVETGIREGERRAMQRAHKLLDDSRITSYADDGSFCRAWNNKLWELKKKIGLSDKDDEVQP